MAVQEAQASAKGTSRAPRCLTCSILRWIQLTWATKCGDSLLRSRGRRIQIAVGLFPAETRGWALLCLRITVPPMIPANTREESLVFSREGIWCLPSRIQRITFPQSRSFGQRRSDRHVSALFPSRSRSQSPKSRALAAAREAEGVSTVKRTVSHSSHSILQSPLPRLGMGLQDSVCPGRASNLTMTSDELGRGGLGAT